MSTTHYSPSTSAAATERYIRGKEDERGVAITCDVPGGPGAFAARARALTQNTPREVEALHYRQSFSDEEFDPRNPEDVQRVNDLGYLLAKKMHPHSDALVVTHTDGHGGKAHNHILVINHNDRTGKALSDYRTFHDRKAGSQRGLQTANDELMLDHGLSVVKRLAHTPADWELRREDFAEESLDREMGDRMSEALADPRAVDKAGLIAVIDEQNQQLDDNGDRVPRMRLHSPISKKGKRAGLETWTLYIEDRRGVSGRAERRKRVSALSADFTPEGAQAFFDYHQDQKEKGNERSARQVEAERAERADYGDAGIVDLDGQRCRAAPHQADESGGRSHKLREGDGRGADDAARPVDLAAERARLDAARRRDAEQAERDREDARQRERDAQLDAERQAAERREREAVRSRRVRDDAAGREA